MTAVVGILCQDGLVIGTDSSATLSHNTIEQPTQKLFIVNDEVIVAFAGDFGLAQRFRLVCQRLFRELPANLEHRVDIGRLLSASALQDFAATGTNATQFCALVGFSYQNDFHLCLFSQGNFQPYFLEPNLWFTSMGNGSQITDPFLALIRDVFWSDRQPTVQDGRFAVTWALSHAIDVNTGGINGPIQMAVLEQQKMSGSSFQVRKVDEFELREHMKNVSDAKEYLRNYVESQQSDEASDVPQLGRK